MKQRRRIYYSAAQRSEIWDRWKAREPMSAIGRGFDRESSSVFSVISPTGGIRPPDRHRAKQALSLYEREEISRGLSTQCSLRSIARRLGRYRAKRTLGERGPVWWKDGAPDLNRPMAKNTSYADWFAEIAKTSK